MAEFDFVESIGGSSRMITLLTLVIHFINPLLCIANYLNWVRLQNDVLGTQTVSAYLAMSIISALFYLLVSSVFYMWAWRFPEPEEIAKRRRIYGVFTNLFFSDFPIFLVAVSIIWAVGAADGLQVTSFIFNCISLLYSGLRVWTFVMVKVIKVQAPQGFGAPPLAVSRQFDAPNAYQPRGPSYAGSSYTPDPRNGPAAAGVVPGYSGGRY